MEKKKVSNPLWVLMLVSTLLLGACGGGGGGSDAPSFKPPEIPADDGSSDPDENPDDDPPTEAPDEEPEDPSAPPPPDPGDIGAGPSASLTVLDNSSASVPPSKVRLAFQVDDERGRPVAGLGTDDFRLVVSGQDISRNTESYMTVMPVSDLRPEIRTVFVLDVSASVSESDFQRAVDSLRELLLDESGQSRLQAGHKVAIVIFDGTVETFMDMTRSSTSIDRDLDRLANLNRPARPDNSSTNLYQAALAGLGHWEDSLSSTNVTQGYMVIIGDGADTAGEHTLQETVQTIQASGKRVFTQPVGNIDERGIRQLRSLASERLFASERSDYADLEYRLDLINEQITELLDSVYLLEFVSSARFNEHELTLVYDTGVGQPRLETLFSAQSFAATPRELWVNSARLTADGLPSDDVNIPLGGTVTFEAETRWTSTPGDYQWSLAAPSAVVSLDPATTDSPGLQVTGNSVGTADIRLTDTANVVGAGSSADLTEVFTVYVSDMEVTASRTRIMPDDEVELRVHANGDGGTGPYSWALDPDDGHCALQGLAGETVTLRAVDTVSDHYRCGVTVSDQSGGRYHLTVEVGTEGEPLEVVSPTAGVDYDFESPSAELADPEGDDTSTGDDETDTGSDTDTTDDTGTDTAGDEEAATTGLPQDDARFSPWEITAVSSLEGMEGGLIFTEDNGEYVLLADEIGNGESTGFEFTSTTTSRISFDYAINTEPGGDVLEFLIDGQVVLQESGFLGWSHYDSGLLSAGTHTFTWRYVKDSGTTPYVPQPAVEAVALDNIDFE